MKLEELHSIATSEVSRGSTRMLAALELVQQRAANRGATSVLSHVYGGTVPPAVVARRRAKNRMARKTRAAQRRAAR